MRVGVFNAHWATLGGGEQVAAGIAAALAAEHDVDLVVTDSFDAEVATERLGVDVRDLLQREIGDGTRAFVDATADYDVFINSSFASTYPQRSRAGLYYVHFPMPNAGTPGWRRVAHAMVDHDPLHGWIERPRGNWLPEFRGGGCWTGPLAELDLVVPRGLTLPFTLRLSARAWPVDRVPHVEVRVGDEVLFDGVVSAERPRTLSTVVTGRGVADPLAVRVRTDTFVPRVELGTDDDRELGVVLSDVALGRRRPSLHPRALSLAPVIARHRFDPEFLDSYGSVVANSAYTAEWTERLWGRTPSVLAPPVHLREPGTKRRVILAVGRFFPNTAGHSKKQLELVQAFRRAIELGLSGWELHLVGGCKPTERGYVEDVRRAAVGLPVHFHVNASGEDLAELFAAAQVFWHGAGMGEDVQRHPDRLEHSGITVVEAMSAGAVPVVFEDGGPGALVREFGCGRTYRTVDELAATTIELVADEAQLDRLAEAAAAASEHFAFDHFAEQVHTLVDELIDADPARG